MAVLPHPSRKLLRDNAAVGQYQLQQQVSRRRQLLQQQAPACAPGYISGVGPIELGKWVTLPTPQQVTLRELQPGGYSVAVRAMDEQGQMGAPSPSYIIRVSNFQLVGVCARCTGTLCVGSRTHPTNPLTLFTVLGGASCKHNARHVVPSIPPSAAGSFRALCHDSLLTGCCCEFCHATALPCMCVCAMSQCSLTCALQAHTHPVTMAAL
jgi:hypothetical protein